MFRLTWRNLVARKVRLVMSTLAIVLGIGFLAGVLTFSHGLGATFDNIIEGSTSDALVRTEGEVSFQASGAGTTKLVEPQVVDRLAELPEVAGRRRVRRRRRCLPARQGRQARRRHRRAHAGVQLLRQRQRRAATRS